MLDENLTKKFHIFKLHFLFIKSAIKVYLPLNRNSTKAKNIFIVSTLEIQKPVIKAADEL